mmetsp:Transcript_2980/g.18753  ORF Transcript_2980/g.18753 Transcript_2980/m.18753 type:complete len:93 (+) Transcript_2980:836-1114(+)
MSVATLELQRSARSIEQHKNSTKHARFYFPFFKVWSLAKNNRRAITKHLKDWHSSDLHISSNMLEFGSKTREKAMHLACFCLHFGHPFPESG